MAVDRSGLRPRSWGEGEIRGPVHRFREGLVLRCLRRELPDGRVLDAGCGSGSMTLALARLGYQVEGVEESAGFVEMVAERIAANGLGDRAQVCRGTVTALECGTASFDGLVCCEVLEHLRPACGGDVAAVREFARALRPGGVCAVSVPLNPALWDHADEWAGHVRRYTREDLVALFRQAGFAVRQVRSWGFPLGRLYHGLLFGPWLRRMGGGEAGAGKALPAPLVDLAAFALRLDEAFGRWPWGRGLVLIARRSG